MLYPPTPVDEEQRLAALRRYALLDTPPEAGFDRLTGLAARLFDVPLALVTLIDRERQWFKSCQGPAGIGLSLRETPREIAFCAHTILSENILVVEDTCLDARFAGNPLVVGDPHVRFYAGAPLITACGQRVGSLCLIDFQPRSLSVEQLESLRDLAAGVVSEMELRSLMAANDVMPRGQAEEALRQMESRLRMVVSNLPVVVWGIDAEGVFTFSEGLGLGLLGLKPGQVVGQSALELYRDDPQMVAQLRQALAGRIHFWRDDVNGIPFETHVTPLRTDDGKITGIIGVSEDISRQMTLEAEREELLAQTESLLADALHSADHDPLTGLLNHRAFHKRLEHEAREGGQETAPLALLLMDLDDFKFFNDAYGHLAGDDLLRQVAQALNCCAGASDTLARFGGDEFALLMPGATQAEAMRMAEDLHDAIAQVRYRPPGYDTAIPLSFSIGHASLPEDGSSRLSWIEAADARLRVAKSGGDDTGDALRLRQRMARSVTGFSMLDALVTAVDNKDRYTRKHSEDVMTYSAQIARELGMDPKTLHAVEVAALLHDVGKIGVPDHILRKPGRLSDQDFAAVKQHPLIGSVIVAAVPGFEAMLDAVRHHHERWDGEGYPFGLKGEEIPLMARLMAVADAYSAMTTDRPYRKGMDAAQALRILKEGAGTQWDPLCVAAFLKTRP